MAFIAIAGIPLLVTQDSAPEASPDGRGKKKWRIETMPVTGGQLAALEAATGNPGWEESERGYGGALLTSRKMVSCVGAAFPGGSRQCEVTIESYGFIDEGNCVVKHPMVLLIREA